MRRLVSSFLALTLAALPFTACGDANDTGSSPFQSGGGYGGGGGVAAGGGALGDGTAGGSGGGGVLPQGCASDTYDGQLVPLDMYVMLDKSGSMSDGGKWGAVSSGLTQFVDLPEVFDIGIGLAKFPTPPATPPAVPPTCTVAADCGAYGPCLPIFGCEGALMSGTESCVSVDYTTPIVPIANLPGNASAFKSALASISPGGGTPTLPALQGALDYAKVWAEGHPDRITIVVLATDGLPTSCTGGEVAGVAAVAATAFAGTPSLKTFVIGVGSELSALNQIAQSGGTGQALILTGSNAQEFLDALNQIRGAIGCQYVIPPPPAGQNPDYGRVNLAFTPEGGPQTLVKKVGGASECVGGPGWYYDNPANPTKILLCPSSCDTVEFTPGKMDIVLGCETIVN